MQTFHFPSRNKKIILALGGESAGNFSLYSNGKIYFSEDFGDLLEDKNWQAYKKSVSNFLKKNGAKPDIILEDLHPLFRTTAWGQELAQKFSAEFIQLQHHHAHIFSSLGDEMIHTKNYGPKAVNYCIAIDGTGYAADGKIWGGEVFRVESRLPADKAGKSKVKSIERIGHLENQVLIGGEMAIREPVRIIISIAHKFLTKEKIYLLVKKYYSKNEFELLYNQLQGNFNCLKTSSTGRLLDAASVLLGFSRNERKEKHGPTSLLEKNSTLPYQDLKPEIARDKDGRFILNTSYVINYVINYVIKKDKKRLAATVQNYIAEGLWEIIKKDNERGMSDIFLSGGLAKNKIISGYFKSKGAYLPKTIPPGDAGLSFGQVVWYLLQK